MSSFHYFYALQHEARRRTIESLNRRTLKSGGLMSWDQVTLASILSDEIGNACEFAKTEWPRHRSDATHGDFSPNWGDIAQKKFKDPDHFNLAIWQKVEGKQVLAALAIGNPSHSRRFLTIKWVERYFGYTPLAGRALLAILTCAEEYGNLLGSEKVLIKDPLDPNKYERYGYAKFRHPNIAFGGNYMSKDLENGTSG